LTLASSANRRSRMRKRSSPAAFRVNVMAATREIATAGAADLAGATISTKRLTRIEVLPVPAPAFTITLRSRSVMAASRSA
jgi:hypothetical protein